MSLQIPFTTFFSPSAPDPALQVGPERTPDYPLPAAIVHSSEDAIFSTTLEGIVTSWNPAAKRLFGYEEAQIVGSHTVLPFFPDRLKEKETLLGQLKRGDAIERYESTQIHKDGTAFQVVWSLFPIKNAADTVVGVAAIAAKIPMSPSVSEPSEALTPVLQQMMDQHQETLTATAATIQASLRRSFDSTIDSWADLLDLRDDVTEGHTERVTELMVRLVRHLGMNKEEIAIARCGAWLHDIGKLAVPREILNKPGPLTDEEWLMMRQHPAIAYEMLAPIAFLGPALDIPYCHHERWNGTGYPRGLKGDEIPLMARLFAVIDVYDALRSDRPYRDGWPEQEVRDYLRSHSGVHFDPGAVQAFLKMPR